MVEWRRKRKKRGEASRNCFAWLRILDRLFKSPSNELLTVARLCFWSKDEEALSGSMGGKALKKLTSQKEEFIGGESGGRSAKKSIWREVCSLSSNSRIFILLPRPSLFFPRNIVYIYIASSSFLLFCELFFLARRRLFACLLSFIHCKRSQPFCAPFLLLYDDENLWSHFSILPQQALEPAFIILQPSHSLVLFILRCALLFLRYNHRDSSTSFPFSSFQFQESR